MASPAVSFRLPNGIETEGRRVLSVDWNRTEVMVFDGVKVVSLNTLEEVACKYPNSFLVLEATGESYELQRRAEVLKAFESANILAYCFKTQRTAWFRRIFGIKKSDTEDAKVIYRIATQTTLSLHRFKELNREDLLRESIKSFLVTDRYRHNGALSEGVATKFLKGVNTSEFQELIFSGKKYRKQIGRVLVVALETRQAGRGFREFRRQLGNYGNGYGSMPRSEFYHWWTRTVTNSRLERNVAKGLKDLTLSQRIVHRQVLREATRCAKFLWRLTA
jgi:hypothetical protein